MSTNIKEIYGSSSSKYDSKQSGAASKGYSSFGDANSQRSLVDEQIQHAMDFVDLESQSKKKHRVTEQTAV
jgi:hypothetical protein